MKQARRIALILIVLLLAVGAVSAQVSTLTYGQEVSATLSAAAPLQLFTFNAAANDLVFVEVVPLTPNLAPTLNVLNPRQESIASSGVNAASVDRDDASAVVLLPEAGLYTVMIGSETAGSGDFIIRLTGVSATAMGAASLPLQLRFDFPTAAYFDLTGDAAAPRRISIDADNPAGLLRAVLTNARAQVVATATGSSSLLISVPPQAEAFHLAVILVEGSGVNVTIGASGGGSGVSVLPQPTAPQSMNTASSSGACSITPANGGTVNIRSGPGEAYSIIGSLAAGQSLTPIGASGTGWYVVNVGAQGWIYSGVVQVSGACNTLPAVAAPPLPSGNTAPTAAPQNPAAPTATVPAPQNVQPTNTVPAPTQPPAVQVAPPDSNYVLHVPLDGSASVGDVVSYPNGDTEDVVSYEVTGLNSNVAQSGGQATLTITATCTGTGTQYITFVADGGQAIGCNQTVLVRVVNFDSRTGAVRIRATGGTDTYVQWMLIANAPRVN